MSYNAPLIILSHVTLQDLTLFLSARAVHRTDVVSSDVHHMNRMNHETQSRISLTTSHLPLVFRTS